MRYNITSDADKVEALKKKTAEHLAARRKAEKRTRKLSRCPSVRRFLRTRTERAQSHPAR
jgi:hypothetical protein